VTSPTNGKDNQNALSIESLEGRSTHQSSHVKDLGSLPDVSASSHRGCREDNAECGHVLLSLEAEDAVYGADLGELQGIIEAMSGD
jgi:hypothetical protein